MANGTQVTTSVSIIQSLNGWQAISLSEMVTSGATVIKAGSKIEISSGFFTFDSDDMPQASTWTAITTGLTAYITLTPSGIAGEQILTSKWSDAEPVWSVSKQGYYTSDASSIRVIGGCCKSGATSYEGKFIMRQSDFGDTEGRSPWMKKVATAKTAYNDWWAAIAPYIPKTGDYIPIHAWTNLTFGSIATIYTGAYRYDATFIYMFRVLPSVDVTVVSLGGSSGAVLDIYVLL